MYPGCKFSSFEQFYSALKEYERTTFTNYWIRDSKSLEARTRAFPSSIAATARIELRYSYMRIFCHKGGRKVPRQGASNEGCPSGMCVRLTRCGQFLEVVQFNEEHNHEISEALFKRPSNIKRLKELEFKVHEKQEKSGCQVTINDLAILGKKHNLKQDLFECVYILKNIYHCEVQMLCDADDNVLCLFFQDPIMKKWLDAYPEIIFLETISCTHRKKAVVYLVMVEDSEGYTNLAAVGISLIDNELVFDWFLKRFKESSPRTVDVKIVFSDSNVKKKSAVKRNFANVFIQTSFYHTFHTFVKDVSQKNMNLTVAECEKSRQILKNLAEATSGSEYENEYETLKNSAPKNVVEYFEKKWHPIKNQWVSYLTYSRKTRKYDDFYPQMKFIVSEIMNLEEFIKMFFMFLNSCRCNKDLITIQKVSFFRISLDATEELYRQFLTNYAFEKIQEKFQNMRQILTAGFNQEVFKKRCDGAVELSPNSCHCSYWTAVGLPCEHILKYREMLNMSLFDSNLCKERWTRDYYEKQQITGSIESNEDLNLDVSLYDVMTKTDSLDNRKVLINHKKFKIMSDECLKLSNLTSVVSDNTFFERLEFIQSLIKKWTGSDATDCFEAVTDLSSRGDIPDVKITDEETEF